MQHSSFVRDLQLVNYQADAWLRPQNLFIVILESDNNVYFNPKLEKILFDTTNDLIMLKYSPLVPVSGFLNKFSYNATQKCIMVSSPFGSVYSSKEIREPQAGDKIYAYDPVLKEYTYSTISSIAKTTGSTILYFSDNNLISKISSTTYGMRFFLLLKEIDIDDTLYLDNPAVLFTEKDLTEYEADVFIGLDRVAGFEFNKTWG